MPLPPLFSIDAHGSAWFAEAATAPRPAGGLRLGLLLGGHFDLGATAELGSVTEGDTAGLALRLDGDLRWLHGDVAHRHPSAWIGVGAGAFFPGTASPFGVGPGVGVEVPIGPVLARLGVDVRLGEEDRAIASLGLGWRKAPPAPPLPDIRPPPEPGPALSGVRVWIPHPWCVWLPVESAGEVLRQLPPGTRVRVTKPGYLPAEFEANAVQDAKLEPMPKQGGLTVAGAAGDKVSIGERPVALGPVASVSNLAAEGLVRIEVTGGGRHASDQVVVTAGRALWVNLPLPEPLELRFALNSAVVEEAPRALLLPLVQQAGDWTYEISGSASPEGDAAKNERLALARAEATRDALVAAGLPADRVRVVASHSPDSTLPLEAQRTARITPVSP